MCRYAWRWQGSQLGVLYWVERELASNRQIVLAVSSARVRAEDCRVDEGARERCLRGCDETVLVSTG